MGDYTTVGELGEKLTSLEQEISPWAKAGVRAYTKDELFAYETSKALIAYLEKEHQINGGKMKDWWALHAPTQHRTLKESKPFNVKGDEVEVFDRVIEKISNGRGDEDDRAFLKEIEKRLGVRATDKEVISASEELKDIANRLVLLVKVV